MVPLIAKALAQFKSDQTGALAGAAMLSNSPGTVADISTDQYRALAFSIWGIGPMSGPVTGPSISGFVAAWLEVDKLAYLDTGWRGLDHVHVY